MHELSLLENVLEIMQEQAKVQKFTRVKQITLQIGRLSCVEAEALRFAFDVVMKDTLADTAELVITFCDGVGICRQCRQKVTMDTRHDPCCKCGHRQVDVVHGGTMTIENLLVI